MIDVAGNHMVFNADCGAVDIPPDSVDCIVTSPPYWGLRDYGTPGEGGHENTVDEYIDWLDSVGRWLWRSLADDGIWWLNVGDRYDGELLNIPFRLVERLKTSGWIHRSTVIWHKLDCKPENVTNRPVLDWEPVFMLTKKVSGYWYNQAGMGTPLAPATIKRCRHVLDSGETFDPAKHKHQDGIGDSGTKLLVRAAANILKKGYANGRAVWPIGKAQTSEGHFAVFPLELARRCITASLRPDRQITVLDPFAGSGTVALVAQDMGQKSVSVELNPAYAQSIVDKLTRMTNGEPLEKVRQR